MGSKQFITLTMMLKSELRLRWTRTITSGFSRLARTYIGASAAIGKTRTVLGREPGVLGSMEGDQEGNIWFAFSNHVVEWDGDTYRRYTYTGKNRFPTCLTVKGSHVWL